MLLKEIFAKVLCVDKSKETLKNVERLNNLFITLNLDTNQNLDTIAMFLGLLLHKDIITKEILNHVPVLAEQLTSYFQYIDNLGN